MTVSWLRLEEINTQSKWMLEPVGEWHSEKCGSLNFLSMSLVPAAGWAALLSEPHCQLPVELMPQAPHGMSAEVEEGWCGLEPPGSAASCVLAGE